MKRFFIISIFLFALTAKNSHADYTPLTLQHMILIADCIVYGQIANTQDQFFTLDIEKQLVGNLSEKQINVKRFQDFSCAARWVPYATGQHVFLFLQKNENAEWTIMSAGDEGELPMVDDKVYLSSWYGFDMEFKVVNRIDKDGISRPQYYQAFSIGGGTFYGLEFQLEELSDAITGLRSICTLTYSNGTPTYTYDLAQLNAYKAKGDLHNWLAQQVTK